MARVNVPPLALNPFSLLLIKIMSSNFVLQTEEILSDLCAQRIAYKKQCQKLLHKVFLAFFDACPSVKAVYWHQYTPSFNDGDPCSFTMGDPSFVNSSNPDAICAAQESGDLDGFFTDEGEAVVAMERWSSDFSEFFPYDECKTLGSFISSMDDAMEQIFGDNVLVTATKAGFQTEKYDCGY